MVRGDGRELPGRLSEDRRQALARNIVVGHVGKAPHASEIDTAADVGAAQRLLQGGASRRLLPELFAIDALAVEDAEEHDLLARADIEVSSATRATIAGATTGGAGSRRVPQAP